MWRAFEMNENSIIATKRFANEISANYCIWVCTSVQHQGVAINKGNLCVKMSKPTENFL